MGADQSRVLPRGPVGQRQGPDSLLFTACCLMRVLIAKFSLSSVRRVSSSCWLPHTQISMDYLAVSHDFLGTTLSDLFSVI